MVHHTVWSTPVWSPDSGRYGNHLHGFVLQTDSFSRKCIKQNGYEFNIEEGRLENWIQN